MNPTRNQGVRISPPHPIVSSKSQQQQLAATKSEGNIFEYQNIQQQCDVKLLKELHLKQNGMSGGSSGGGCSSGDENNNRKGNCDKKSSALAFANNNNNHQADRHAENNRKKLEKENKQNKYNHNNKAKKVDSSGDDSKPPKVVPQRRMQNLRHEYYNIMDNEVRSKSPLVRKTQLPQPVKNSKSPVQITKPERKMTTPEKQSNNILSKFLNMDIKSPKAVKKPFSNSSSSSNTRSSSGNSFNSFDSIEQAIILGKNEHLEGHSYLGPFNFRQLLRPTQGPTESLRKRKGVVNPSSPPPHQRGKNT